MNHPVTVGLQAPHQPTSGSVNRHAARRWSGLAAGSAVLVLTLVAGCTSRSLSTAPVEDRGTSRTTSSASAPSKLLPGSENSGKPGFYTVKPGDTLIRIGLDTGQNWRDISRWNTVENPNLIEVGQVLRVAPPVANEAVVARPVQPSSAAVSAPLPAQGASAPRPVTAQQPSMQNNAANTDEDLAWIWPAQGTPIAGFDEVKNKGIDIAGRTGDPVLAAADGRVVYSGAGLRGYGNLIILKHNNTFLTAYAHNQTLLVKEDQSVRQGQKIAEMGNSDADRVKLHFEIRRQGKPVDPMKFLPVR